MTSKVLKITFRITCACLAIAAIGSGARYIYARNAADRAPAAQSKVAAAAVPVLRQKSGSTTYRSCSKGSAP